MLEALQMALKHGELILGLFELLLRLLRFGDEDGRVLTVLCKL